MERASPVELRNALHIAQNMANSGIGFVCVPYSTQEELFELTNQAHEVMTKMENLIEQENK